MGFGRRRRSQTGPAQAGDDGLLEAGVEVGENTRRDGVVHWDQSSSTRPLIR